MDALVEALGGASGISKSEVSRICHGLDDQGKTFLQRPLDHGRFPYVYLDATYLHGRLGSLKERGLDGTRLVISDAHLGLTAAIKRMFQGCSWQRCRVHFLRNLLSHVPIGEAFSKGVAGQDMVAAAM